MTPTALRCALALLAAGLCRGAEPAPLRIWPGAAPGEKGDLGVERTLDVPKTSWVAGRPILTIGDVSDPTITLYRPPAGRASGAAVVVMPGGGFYLLAMDLEGTEPCAWLNSLGVTAVLLKYRVPRRDGVRPYAAPLQDAQRAIGIVRSRAKEWGIDPGRIGTLGFSAGGDLSAALCAHVAARTYPRVDDADDLSCRPDFQLLVYPAYLVPKSGGYELRPEVAVSDRTPPTFVVMSQVDSEGVQNALGYALALQQARVPMELHIYPTGKHGCGLRPTGDLVTAWPQRAADWMRARGLLGP